jgi:hypothetical protein
MSLTLKKFIDLIRLMPTDEEAQALAQRYFIVGNVSYRIDPHEKEWIQKHPEFILQSIGQSIGKNMMEFDGDVIDFSTMGDDDREYYVNKTFVVFRPAGDGIEVADPTPDQGIAESTPAEAHPEGETDATPPMETPLEESKSE